MSFQEDRRMAKPNMNDSFLAEIGWLHYHQGLSQTEIADRLDVSKMVVSRSIRRAFEAGIISVEIRSPFTYDDRLARSVSERFPDVKCTVVREIPDETASTTIGRVFAHLFFLEEHCGSKIGIGLGSTVAQFVEHLTPFRTTGVSVVQLIGGMPMAGAANPFSILHGLSQKLGATGYHFPATAVVDTPAERDALFESGVPATAAPAQWKNLSCAIFGIGRIADDEPRTALLNPELGTPEDAQEILASSAVCDLLGHCIAPDGKEVHTGVSNRVAGIPGETLLSVPRRIALAGGEKKAEAIEAAIRSGFITDLVTDRVCAQAIIKRTS